MKLSKLFCGSALFLIAAACGGSKGAPEAPSAAPSQDAPSTTAQGEAPAANAGEASPAEASSAPTKRFAELTQDEKLKYMKEVIVPSMRTVFQEYDSNAFAQFGCVTCHGPGAKQGQFRMPTSALPKLNANDGFAVHQQKSPEMLNFMMQKVVPEMAKLLGEPVYDPATHQGFGCGGCHEFEK